MGKYAGLYRAKVVSREDERQRGRIQVQIPSVSGDGKSQMVDVCSGCAYDLGGDIAVPKLGDTVWIAFEEGDVNKPVYMGNFFAAFKTPLSNYDTDTRVISWDNCRIEMKGDHLNISVGSQSIIDITGSNITMKSGTINLN